MKTTIELPDPLLQAAKTVALKRGTTLKAILEHALARDIAFQDPPASRDIYELNRHSFPVLKPRKTSKVTNEVVHKIMQEEGI